MATKQKSIADHVYPHLGEPRAAKAQGQPSWQQRSRFSKLANVLYPSAATEAEMASLAKAEGKRAPSKATLLSDAARGSLSPLGGAVQQRKGK